MPRPMTRKERQANTRRCLMRSAARVFAKHGLQHASIDDVAHDAGYTKGAFYANFASKEDLFLAMLEERFAERMEQIEAIGEREGEDIEEQAREAGDEFVRYLASDTEWQRLFFEFAAYASRNEEFRLELVSRYRSLRERLARSFISRAEGIDGPLAVDPERLATMTFAMANGFALERLLEPDAVSDEDYGVMLMVFFAGLRALAEQATAPTGAESSS